MEYIVIIYGDIYYEYIISGLMEGTHARGRVLIEVIREKQDKRGKCKFKEGLDQNGLNKIKKYRNMKAYEIKCDLYQGTEIKKVKNREMFIQVCIDDIIAESASKDVNDDGSINWYQCIKSKNNSNDKIGPFNIPEINLNKYIETPNDNNIELPDIMVYLCIKPMKKVLVCAYTRINLKDILNGKRKRYNNPPKWYDLKENVCLDKYDDDSFPGSVLLSFNIAPVGDVPKQKIPKKVKQPQTTQQTNNNNNTKPVKQQKKTHCNIKVDIIKGNEIPGSYVFI